jgi:hypothetical protein
MTMTKKDAAMTLADKGIALPDNWSKLSTERAVAWATDALADLPAKGKKVGIIGHAKAGLMAVGAALAGMGATVVEAVAAPEPAPLDKAARKNATMKVFSDPKYRKTTRKMRRFFANNSRRPIFAADPVPMTRQVARRKALDSGFPASAFRQFMGA